MNGFLPGIEYTAQLMVENDCGETAFESITFTLPMPPPGDCFETAQDIIIKSLFPNPFTNEITIEYSTEQGGHLEIWLISFDSSTNDLLLNTEQVSSAGTYTRNVNTSQASPGFYYLTLDLNGEIIGQSLIKI